ncbi:substrate-binding and VWA domain-containing protein [Rhizohabitans arisaemae]|uniref:substrate-binding and VWA domain-containing protein n=1 Tax=Rhizohabitans arisaemae TaxID=2720610 RepID=UPI0024B16AFE|nr:substrate-binding and VWA domain-containing protein [Rhizohabitans arisaemae]
MYGPPTHAAPDPFQPPPDPPVSAMRRKRGPKIIGAILSVVSLAVATGIIVYANNRAAACAREGTRLTLLTSPEKAGPMRRFAEEFGARECVRIQVAVKNSGEAMSALARGWNETADGSPRPDIWSPASSGWVNLLRHRLGGEGDVIPEENPSIANSPLVIAMPKPMAEVLGWPEKKIGWSDVLKLAQDPLGWGRHGHAEWGKFRLGKTNPNFSTSGLNATIGAYFAATQRSHDLAKEDLDDPRTQSFVRGVESSIVHYGDTTLTFLSALLRADAEGRGPSYVSAVTVEELSVWHYNQGNPTGDPEQAGRLPKPKTPLVAIYPKEGTLVSDHPFVSFTWADATRRKVAAKFLTFLRGESAQREFGRNALRDHRNRPTELITRENGLLPDEPAQTLAAPDPAVLDTALRNWEKLRKRANVLVVLDVSGSMNQGIPRTRKTKLAFAKESLDEVFSRFIDADRVGFWVFSTNQRGSVDWRQITSIGPMSARTGERTRRDTLKQRLKALSARGGTGLYDTTAAAHAYLGENLREDAINSVVLLTDGRNEDAAGIDVGALLKRLRGGEKEVRIFSIAYGRDADLDVLRRISEATDAKAYDSGDASSLTKVLTAVTSNF